MSTQAPAPQRVCPHCATVTATAAPSCPWCGGGYRRRSPVGAIAALLLVQAVVVLGGVYVMLTVFGDTLQTELDDQVQTVQRDFTRQLERVEKRIRDDLPGSQTTP